jgi:uncharacterized glyoxalase superfamily protein PhnB
MPATHFTPSDIHPCLTYDDAAAAIEWLCQVFGFQKRLVVPGPDHSIIHSELSLGTGVIMVSSPKPESNRRGPAGEHGSVSTLSCWVDNPDAHYANAVAHGVLIVRPLCDEEYGARGYGAQDLEGHQWYFGNYRPGAYWDT